MEACQCACCVLELCVSGLECCSKCNTSSNTQTNYRRMPNRIPDEWKCHHCSEKNTSSICNYCGYNKNTETSTGMKRFKSKKSVKKSLKKSKKLKKSLKKSSK
jgi:hypothetical protein